MRLFSCWQTLPTKFRVPGEAYVILNVMKKTAIIFFLLLASCMKYGPPDAEDFRTDLDPKVLTGMGLFVVNEGNFMYGNASLSYYDARKKEIQNHVFARANAIPLGDVAQSMTIHNGLGWVVLNNSGIIFAIDINTFKVVGSITGFTSPRHIHFLSNEKAYVTQLWDERICVVDPRKFAITGYIHTGLERGSESTEQMVQYGDYVFTNCWSYNDRLLMIDTRTDEVVDEIRTGLQPSSIALDCNNKIWVTTDGAYTGSPQGNELPSLCRIDAQTRQIEKWFWFGADDSPRNVTLNGARDTLYMINRDVWRMPVDAEVFPQSPFIAHRNTRFYALTVNPVNSEVYVADAIDYVQPGVVLRYSPEGELLDEFKAGITPGAFCWR